MLAKPESGATSPCGWVKLFEAGNIHQQPFEEIWSNDKKWLEFRESILDGSFRFCSEMGCTKLANNSLPDWSREQIDEFIANTPLPTDFNCAYDATCNHACPSCRHEHFKGDDEYYASVRDLNKKMLPYFNKARRVSVDGTGEFFASQALMEMVQQLEPEREDFELLIETNAALFNEQNWNKIKHLSRYKISVVVTIASFVDSTYRYVSGYSNHVEQLIENLKFIRKLREDSIINHLTMSMIVQESNFRELPVFVDRCLNEFKADDVRIRAIMHYNVIGEMNYNEFWLKDIYNPAHPFHSELKEILEYPIMKDSRVWYWHGDYTKLRGSITNPADKFEAYFGWMSEWMLRDDKKELYNKWREKFLEKKVAIYGAGKFGRCVKNILEDAGIKPVYFIDRYMHVENQANQFGIPVLNLKDQGVFENVDIIIITPICEVEQISSTLRNDGGGGVELMPVAQLLYPTNK